MEGIKYLKGPQSDLVIRDPVVGERESSKRMEYAERLIPILADYLTLAGYPYEEITVVASVKHGLANEKSDLDISVISTSSFYPEIQIKRLLVNLLLMTPRIQDELGESPGFGVDSFLFLKDKPNVVYGLSMDVEGRSFGICEAPLDLKKNLIVE